MRQRPQPQACAPPVHARVRTAQRRIATGAWVWVSLAFMLLLHAASAVDAQTEPPADCSAATGTCVRIGYFNCPWGGSLCSSVVGHDRMIDWYRDRVATKLGGRMAGAPVLWVRATFSGFFTATAAEVYDTVDRLFIGDAARSGTGSPLVDFVILPFGSIWDTAMQLMERHRIPSIGASSPDSKLFQCAPTADVWNVTQPGCTAPNSRRYKYAHGASNPGEQYFQPWVGLLKLRKARTIAMIRTPVPFYATVRAGVVSSAAENNIHIVYDELVQLNTAVTPAVLEGSTVERVISEVRAAEPDAFLIITQDCVPWIEEMERQHYTPKSVAAVLCADGSGPLGRLGDRLRYVVGSAQWVPELRGVECRENADLQPWSLFPKRTGDPPSPLQFQQLFRTLMNSSTIVPAYGEAALLAGFSMLEGAITLAGTVDPVKVQAQLLTYYQPSFYGLITTNRFGMNEQKRLIISQRDEFNALHIISPSAISTHDFIYPMPRFDERTYRPSLMSSTVERVVIALVALCAACTAALALVLFAHRRTQTFQVAGLSFYMLVALGCISACLSIATWGVENSGASCSARIWMWSLSFHLFVDPFLAVSYRMARATTAKLYRKSNVDHAHLLAGCAAIVAPQILLNAMWTGLAPLRPTVVTEDPLRPAFTSFTSCESDDVTASAVFLALTLLYSGLLLLALCLLVQRVRRVRGLYSDARAIAVSVYLFVMTATVVLVVQATLGHHDVESERVLFGLRSVGLLVAYQVSTALLFLPRVLPLLSVKSLGWKRRPLCARAVKSHEGSVSTPTQPSVEGEGALADSLQPPQRESSPSLLPVADVLARSVHFTSSAPGPYSDHSRATHRVGDSERSTVALPLHVAALADARIPLPPHEHLLALPLEETVAIVAHFHSIILQLCGDSGWTSTAPAPVNSSVGAPVVHVESIHTPPSVPRPLAAAAPAPPVSILSISIGGGRVSPGVCGPAPAAGTAAALSPSSRRSMRLPGMPHSVSFYPPPI